VKTLLLSLVFLAVAAPTARPLMAADGNPDQAAGALLYRDKGCAHCHGAHGEGTAKAPALANIGKNKVWTRQKIRQQILDGGPKMPPFADALSEAEVAQLVALLRSKHWPVPPPASAAN
jgi:mono/diheme cytochrome c family protein